MKDLEMGTSHAIFSLAPLPWCVIFNIRLGFPVLVPADIVEAYLPDFSLFNIPTNNFFVLTCTELHSLYDTAYRDLVNYPCPSTSPLQDVSLFELGLGVSLACNLHCANCFYSRGELSVPYGNRERLMPAQLVHQVLSWYLTDQSLAGNENHKHSVRFGAAESMLNWDAIEYAVRVAEGIRGKGEVEFTIDTNLTLLDKKRAKMILEHDFEVFTSIDGRKRFHNQRRVSVSRIDSFDLTTSAIKHLLGHGLEPSRLHVTATLTDDTYPGVDDDFILQLIDLGIRSIFLEVDSICDIGVSSEELAQRITRLGDLARDNSARVSGLWETPLLKLAKSRVSPLNGVFCAAIGGKSIDVLPDGTVRHCCYANMSAGMFDDFVVGNLAKFRTNLNFLSRRPWDECFSCPLEFACGGQCLATREAILNGGLSPKGLATLCSAMRQLTLQGLRRDALRLLAGRQMLSVMPLVGTDHTS